MARKNTKIVKLIGQKRILFLAAVVALHKSLCQVTTHRKKKTQDQTPNTPYSRNESETRSAQTLQSPPGVHPRLHQRVHIPRSQRWPAPRSQRRAQEPLRHGSQGTWPHQEVSSP